MLKFIDIFAGTGGIRIGLEQACKDLNISNECIFSSEIDKRAAESYQLNFKANPLCDITKIDETSLPDFDLMLAGFPCQSFSYAGKRKGFADTRGTLFFDVERILKVKKPKYFLLENVRGLTTHDKGRTFDTIKHSLKSLGYGVDFLLLNSSNFDVPQNRVRIYILGVLESNIKITIESDLGAADTHAYKLNQNNIQQGLFKDAYKTQKSVSDILEEKVDRRYNCSDDFITMLSNMVGENFDKLHGCRLIDYRGGKSLHSWELGVKGNCSSQEIELMNLLIANRRKKVFGTHQDGKSLTAEQIKSFYHSPNFSEITSNLIKKGYLSLNDGKYNPVCGNMSFEVFKFLDPDGISITLTSSDCNRLGIIQNNMPRRITPRECARLQGYPESYKLLNDDLAVYKQMGNAVTVPVVKAVLTDLLINNFR